MTKNPPRDLALKLELTILMPCLDEARTVVNCIRMARDFLERTGIVGEVLIADNGSTDGSQELARAAGARVVDVPRRGYGAALIAGIEAAAGRYVIMGDSDESYDFAALDPFVHSLRAGNELVMGNRFAGEIRAGAMPALHRFLGNPVLSFVGRLLYSSPIGDFHCGLRGFDRAAMLDLGLQCEGMEFASEMVVKASLHGLRIAEVPTTLSPDGRDRPPHLRSWRDGWRHLRFLLLFSPRWLFLYPGLVLGACGAAGLLALLPGPLAFGSVTLDVHTMLFFAGAVIAGAQMLTLALCSQVFAAEHGILPPSALVERFRRLFTFERGLLCGLALLAAGTAMSVESVLAWDRAHFGAFDPTVGMRIVIPSLTLAMLGLQTFFASLFLGVLDLRAHERPTARAR